MIGQHLARVPASGLYRVPRRFQLLHCRGSTAAVLAALCLTAGAMPQLACAQAQAAAPSMQAACDELKSADFSGVQDAPSKVMESALMEPAGEVPTACLARGYVWPQVGFELKMPASGWNGKMVELGAGGFAGSAQVPADRQVCDDAVRRGYACIHSDQGHTSGPGERGLASLDGLWAYDNLQAELDYAYRSLHVLALAEKAIVQRFYGAPPQHSYFVGCSNGGRQALVAAQRFPWDFDGILAMEPALDLSGAFTTFLYDLKAVTDDAGKPLFASGDLKLMHNAAVAACDADDGLRDGVIGNPPACKFDPAQLACTAAQQSGCLTPVQVAAAHKVYAGPKTSRGRVLYRGHPMPGSEEGVFGFAVTKPIAVNAVADFFRYLAFMPDAGPGWKPADFDFDADYQRESVMEGLYASSNPDLRPFHEAGGKLLLVQGWTDSGTPFPLRTIDYYETVEKVMGGPNKTAEFARLFMVPGRDHCGGGDGASAADYLGSLEAWVEQGQAPDLIKASHIEPVTGAADFMREPADPARVKFTRPLYPYPVWAKYKGSGDPKDYRNFKPIDPRK